MATLYCLPGIVKKDALPLQPSQLHRLKMKSKSSKLRNTETALTKTPVICEFLTEKQIRNIINHCKKSWIPINQSV